MIEEDVAARMVVLASAVMAAAAGEKDHTKVLATSDIYLDFIRPNTLRVTRDGEVSFDSDAGS